MTNYLNKIKTKIEHKLNPEHLELIDKSSLHSKHKNFNSSKFYIKVIIKSKYLREMEKIKAHKIVFSILKEEMKKNIHALEIEIK